MQLWKVKQCLAGPFLREGRGPAAAGPVELPASIHQHNVCQDSSRLSQSVNESYLLNFPTKVLK